MGTQLAVQLRQHDPRLNGDRAVVVELDVAHVTRKIDDQSSPQHRSGHVRPGSPRDDGQAALAGVLSERHDILAAGRKSNADRPNLKQTGIAGIHCHRQFVAAHFSTEDAGQVFNDATLLFVQDADSRSRCRVAAPMNV